MIRTSHLAGFGLVLAMLMGFSLNASAQHLWTVVSPDHGQTFSYGSEQSRVWTVRGKDRHLAVLLNFTNDPYVDRSNPREYDNFTFNFPEIRMGADGRTFYFHPAAGRSVPVAVKRPDFFGVEEIKLLPSSRLIVSKPHGYLSLRLVLEN